MTSHQAQAQPPTTVFLEVEPQQPPAISQYLMNHGFTPSNITISHESRLYAFKTWFMGGMSQRDAEIGKLQNMKIYSPYILWHNGNIFVAVFPCPSSPVLCTVYVANSVTGGWKIAFRSIRRQRILGGSQYCCLLFSISISTPGYQDTLQVLTLSFIDYLNNLHNHSATLHCWIITWHIQSLVEPHREDVAHGASGASGPRLTSQCQCRWSRCLQRPCWSVWWVVLCAGHWNVLHCC